MEINRAEYEGTVKNQKEALEILVRDIPNFSHEEALELDFEGKDQWQYWGDLRRAYFCRVLAARSFERIGENSNYEEEIERLKEAAFSYDKAAKNAYNIKFPDASVKCRERALKIYERLYEITENEKYLKEIKISRNFIDDVSHGRNPYHKE